MTFYMIKEPCCDIYEAQNDFIAMNLCFTVAQISLCYILKAIRAVAALN